MIGKSFQSFNAFFFKFVDAINKIEGPGYCLLAYNKMHDNLEIITTSDCQNLIFDQADDRVPILSIQTYDTYNYNDVTINIWKLVNWNKVAERLETAQSQWKE